jgi:3-methyladenine DNA glycosylase AlkC
MLLVIDKPMTRILPELHEDNELFVLGNMNNSNNVSANNNSGVYKVKRQSEKNQTKNKNAIVKDNFGIQ